MSIADSLAAQTDYTETVYDTTGIIDIITAGTAYQLDRAETMAVAETNVVRDLWEIIDDTQDPNWQSVNNANSPGWAPIST